MKTLVMEMTTMTREQLRSIAIQDGTYKVLGGMSADEFFDYYVDHSLFESREELCTLVFRRADYMTR
jgi:hypothetical protein